MKQITGQVLLCLLDQRFDVVLSHIQDDSQFNYVALTESLELAWSCFSSEIENKKSVLERLRQHV